MLYHLHYCSVVGAVVIDTGDSHLLDSVAGCQRCGIIENKIWVDIKYRP